MRFDIYFDGRNSIPLSVTKEDYLIDSDWLEEGSADSSNPFGVISSNELSFRLFNENGIFSPTNTSSPYFGKIKSGILIIPNIKSIASSEEVDWEKLGEYFVTNWDAKVTGSYADVVANDAWYQIFGSKMPHVPIRLNVPYNLFLSEVMTTAGHNVDVDPLLSTILPYAFIEGATKEFLQSVCAASLAYVTSSKTGKPIIGAFSPSRPIRATLTDADQIKEVSIKQSIVKAYDGVELNYSVPQISDIVNIINLTGIALTQGVNSLSNVAFSTGPLWQLISATIKTPSKTATITSIEAMQWMMSLLINSTLPSTLAELSVYGRVLKMTEIMISDASLSLLKATNKYIQTAAYANYYKSILEAYINNTSPTLSLSIRGNPLLNVGDKIVVKSDKYNLNFTGIVQRMEYKYLGGLSCEMQLLNVNVLQGVV